MSSCEDPRFSAPDLPFVGRPQDAWIYSPRHSAARSPHLRAVVVDAESLGEQLVVDGLRSVVSRCPESARPFLLYVPQGDQHARLPLVRLGPLSGGSVPWLSVVT
jgi:hypothetical protein